MDSQISKIVINTVPEIHLGVMMYNSFGMRLNFKKYGEKSIFQVAVKLDFMRKVDKKKLFEFVTVTNFEIDKQINDNGFYELIFAHMLTAIDDFNRYIKANKSYLTSRKSYPKDISFKNAKEAIRKAWFTQDFIYPSTINLFSF